MSGKIINRAGKPAFTSLQQATSCNSRRCRASPSHHQRVMAAPDATSRQSFIQRHPKCSVCTHFPVSWMKLRLTRTVAIVRSWMHRHTQSQARMRDMRPNAQVCISCPGRRIRTGSKHQPRFTQGGHLRPVAQTKRAKVLFRVLRCS